MKALRNSLRALVALAVIAIAPIAAQAAGTSPTTTVGTITELKTQTVLLVNSSGTVTGGPACASSSSNRFAIDLTTQQGKTMAATVLAAKTAGISLLLQGDGTCSLYGDSENLQTIYFY